MRAAKLGTPYSKWLDPKTYQPHSSYPPNWMHHMSQHIDNTVSLTNNPGFDEATLLNNFHPDPYDWVDGYYDDDLWWALAWITAYDVTDNHIYLSLAEGIFSIVSGGWSTNCGGGGIYWSAERTYVNAIANELFFSTAAHLATRCSNSAFYVSWATRSLTWFLSTGMINDEGTINDGLNATCQNNNGDVWSYNQGVILGGLVQLNRAAPNSSYLPLAKGIASAALANLSDATGVIHDPCEAAESCGADGTQFKGVFMRNLADLQREVGGFEDALNANAESIWIRDRNEGEGGSVFGVNWAGPYEGEANASLQGSAMDGLVAGIRVGGY
jgi:predicted alpha-1,6-mannanase (GH76 family)